MTNRFWKVYLTLPETEDKDKRYHRNRTWGVAAPTLQKAVEIIEREYPGSTIWTIQHQGEIHYSLLQYQYGDYHNEDKNK